MGRRYKDLSTTGRNDPCSLGLFESRVRLTTCNCHFSCCYCFAKSLECPLQDIGLDNGDMTDRLLSMQQDFLLTADMTQEKSRNPCNLALVLSQLLWRLLPRLLLWIGITIKQQRFRIGISLPLDRLWLSFGEHMLRANELYWAPLSQLTRQEGQVRLAPFTFHDGQDPLRVKLQQPCSLTYINIQIVHSTTRDHTPKCHVTHRFQLCFCGACAYFTYRYYWFNKNI